ncbi:hypothetical protein ACYPKM_01270 [Pseudomonas aeruginosa]
MKELKELDSQAVEIVRHFAATTILDRRKVSGRQVVREADRKAIAALPDRAIPFAFAYAVAGGDVDLAEEIWATRGGFELSLIPKGEAVMISSGGMQSRMLISDPGFEFFKKIALPADMKALMRLFQKAFRDSEGFEGDSIEALLHPRKLDSVLNNCMVGKPKILADEFPYLANGELSNPELAIALSRRVEREAFGEIYDHMLCWATPEMVSQFPEQLRAYKVTLTAAFGRLALSPELGMREDSGSARYPHQYMGTVAELVDSFVFTSDTIDELSRRCAVSPEKRLSITEVSAGMEMPDDGNAMDILVAHAMVPEPVRRGFGATPDRILCRTTASFLLGFQSKGVDLERLDGDIGIAARLSNYFPAGILQSMKHRTDGQSISWKYQGFYDVETTTSAGKMVGNLTSMAAINECIRITGKEFLKYLVLEAYNHGYSNACPISPHALPAIREALGIGSGQLKPFALQGSHLNAFERQQYVLDAGTKLEFKGGLVNAGSPDRLRNPFVRILKMAEGDLTINGHKTVIGSGPKAVLEGLTKLRTRVEKMDDKEAQLMAAQAVFFGVEKMVEHCETVGHWKSLYRVFTREEMKPYLRIAPREIRTLQAAQTLGI